MNTCFVSVDPTDKPGDEAVLLGDGLTEATLAEHFHVREHEILCRYTAMGVRHYVAQTPSPAPAVVASKVAGHP